MVVGARPYDPGEVAATVGGELFGVLAEDPIGAEPGRRGVDGRSWCGPFGAAALGPPGRPGDHGRVGRAAERAGGGAGPLGGGGMSWYEPVDRTLGELPVDEQRTLVRRIADVVGRQVAARVEAAAEAGTPMTADAEKVASSTEIQQALRAENERRLRVGSGSVEDTALAGLHDMVLAHVYGLGELEELWNNPEVENIDCNGAGVVFVTFAGGLVKVFPPVAATLEEFLDLIRRVGRRLGEIEVQFDARHPRLDLQLPDGSRMFAVYGGPGTNGVGRRDVPVHPPPPVPGAVDRGAGRARADGRTRRRGSSSPRWRPART